MACATKPLMAVRIAFLIMSILVLPVWAHQLSASETKGQGQLPEPWHIRADKLTFLHKTDVIVAQGGVQVWRGSLRLEADQAVYHRGRQKVLASGGVVIHLAEDVLSGDEGELDLTTFTGTIKNGHLFLRRNNIHLFAKQMWKTGPEEYKAVEASLSTCPLPKQAWNFKCKELKLTLQGNAVAKHATFNIRGIPILYSPWFLVPVNRYRKTGFLLPYFSSSDRNGFGVNVPFFWAINDSMDATFYQHPISNRGWMEGVEFRYVLSEFNKGVFRYNVMIDTLTDNDYNKDSILRDNDRRWWLRGKADQKLPLGFEAKIDVDIISDKDYLHEFDDGPMGYSRTNKIFKRKFGRSLVDSTDVIRPSTFQATREGKDDFIAGEMRYNDNQIPGVQDETVQTLPRILLHAFRSRLWETPFYFDYQADYVHYWRDSGSRYNRVRFTPRLALPFDRSRYGDLLISAGIDESLYQISDGSSPEPLDDTKNRLLASFEADWSSTFARRYGREYRHTIRPRVTYQLRPDKDQSGIPDFDEYDRLEDLNSVKWSVLTFLTRKYHSAGTLRYLDVIRLKIEQDYNFNRDKQKLSDMYAELELRPRPNLFLRYDTTYNFHGLGFTTYNLIGHAALKNGSRLDMDYRYNRTTHINELNLSVWATINRQWYANYSLRKSFAEESELESRYGIRYQSSCWAIEAGLKRDQDDTKFTVHLELLGIGGWSTPSF